ncbi:MAG: hypothetical protein O2958_12340 [Gemmatimonadetes bacterium]|nr:hypothetical protein [Gemmatimonadota bacterium]MDA1102983.1 hypothetical protein [Gemmatimonadota bacterium]
MTRRMVRSIPFAMATVLLIATGGAAQSSNAPAVLGAWTAERYEMAGGGEHEVQGRIFFTARDWQVLFFVIGADGTARRGSAEGGTYTLDGEQLVFTHLFNLSVGEEMRGLPAAALRMTSRSPEGAPLEPTEIDVEGDVLTFHFPSGNRMIFRRR